MRRPCSFGSGTPCARADGSRAPRSRNAREYGGATRMCRRAGACQALDGGSARDVGVVDASYVDGRVDIVRASGVQDGDTQLFVTVTLMDHRTNQHVGMAPRLDLRAAGGVDLARLERALGLRVRRIGVGRYEVTGGREPHWVDLYTRRMPRCDCGDHIWRERVCKHILAVLLREGDERVLGAVARLVASLRAEADRG